MRRSATIKREEKKKSNVSQGSKVQRQGSIIFFKKILRCNQQSDNKDWNNGVVQNPYSLLFPSNFPRLAVFFLAYTTAGQPTEFNRLRALLVKNQQSASESAYNRPTIGQLSVPIEADSRPIIGLSAYYRHTDWKPTAGREADSRPTTLQSASGGLQSASGGLQSASKRLTAGTAYRPPGR